MFRILPLLPLLVLPAPLTAQGSLDIPASFLPSQFELGGFTDIPWMRPEARVQMFYDATQAGASSFTATGLSLRFDGPIPQVGSPGPFTIQRLQISVGQSGVRWPGARFADNLTEPLTTVFDGPVTYWPDQGTFFPAPWGGLNGSLSFGFSQAVAVDIPPGGWFVVEMVLTGNTLNGAAHALLDGEAGPGGPVDGGASSSGQGCAASPGAPPAMIFTDGIHAPGAAHSIWGTNLGANAPVVAILGASDTTSALGPLPWQLPSTACTAYTSWDLLLFGAADASGTVAPGSPGLTVAIPPVRALGNATLYEQLVSVVPGANAPWGLVFSDKRTVRIGTLRPRSFGMYVVASAQSASAATGDWVAEFGYALRIDTR